MAEGMRTALVETLCHDCVIRVLWFFGDEDPRFNYIDVQLISSHSQWWHLRWRNRLSEANPCPRARVGGCLPAGSLNRTSADDSFTECRFAE